MSAISRSWTLRHRLWASGLRR